MEDLVPGSEADIKSQIMVLERSQNRAMREHILGDVTALARLQAIDNSIAALRLRLPI